MKLDRQYRHPIIEKLFDYFERDAIQDRDMLIRDYPTTIKVYLTYEQFARRGATLTNTNIRNFNNFFEVFIKEKFRSKMDDAWRVLPGFEAHLPDVRNQLGISIEHWSDDSMKKEYYRYRVRTGKEILAKGKGFKGGSAKAVHAAF
jgi:hypothetical protein